MASAQQSVPSLYRSFLRVINKWPADPIRPTRNMKTALRSQVTESFRSPLAVSDATAAGAASQDTLASRIKDAQVQLEALQKITLNEFKHK
ncbi:hypothetical protein BGX23_011904, partial [Mortierella sp. AD031]